MNIDFSSDAFLSDPYPALHWLRENDPVHWSDGLKAWCVTRYEDVLAGFRDERLSSERIAPMLSTRAQVSDDLRELVAGVARWLVFIDPPRHTRLRALAQNVFTNAALEGMRGAIEARVDALLGAALEKPRFDFLADIAFPLPAAVIGDVLGVPAERIESLKQWSDDLGAFVLTARQTPDKYTAAAAGQRNLHRLFKDVLDAPGPKTPLVAQLLRAQERDQALDEAELLSYLTLLLFAGHETTTQFLTNGMRALLLHPEAHHVFAETAQTRTDWPTVINEILRWDGPSMAMSRMASTSFTWHGRSIREGDRLYLFVAGANHDPRVFEQPERFDPARLEARRGIPFGYGIHTCLGLHLARLEGEVAFRKIVPHLPRLRLAREPLKWRDTLINRGVHNLVMENVA